MSTWGWVALAAGLSALSAQRAEACSCSPTLEITHPSTTSIAAWDGLVGRTVFVGTPTVAVTYVDDPAQQPIAGTFTNLSGSDVVALWTFVPSAPLTVGRTIRAVVSGRNGFAQSRAYEYVVSTATVGAGPTFPGVTSMTAVVSNFHGSAGGSCAPSGSNQSRVGFPGLPSPNAEGPIYRYYFYPQGGQPGASGLYGIEHYYISTIRCGNPGLLCEPTYGGLVVGQTICARVEAIDLLGRTSGFSSEACATVGEEEVDLVSPVDFRVVSCVPHEDDAGVGEREGGSFGEDRIFPDAGTTSGAPDSNAIDEGPISAARDAATGGGGGTSEESDGCVCVRGSARSGVLSALGVLACGLVLVLRRRLTARA